MCRKFICLMSFVLLVSLAVSVQAYEFADDFNEPRDFLTEDVYDTGWDGFVGLGLQETVDVLRTDEVRHPNELYMQSMCSRWEPEWFPLGPFLYREIYGDFIATVQVTDFAGCPTPHVYHNDCGIMARVPDLDAAGPGEDLVCVHYFPTWFGNMGRDVNDGVEEYEWGQTGDDCGCAAYLQLERSGNTFYFRISFDGEIWTSLDTSGSPYDVDGHCTERLDFDGLPLQVGLQQAVYSGATGWVAFDDYRLIYDVANPYARGPSPKDEAVDVDVNADLYWVAGDLVQDVDGHEVYFGTDFDEVKDGTISDYIVSDPCRAMVTLAFGTEYFWRVNEVNELNTVWEGDVWSFTSDSGKARDSDPRDNAIGVSPHLQKLGWTPSPYAVSQDVYFGTDADDVNTSVTAGISGLDGNVGECDVPAALPLVTATNYYWRVDTNNGVLPATKGDVWTFQTEVIVFCDDFNDRWDFLTEGPGKWDGFVGLGEGETVSKLEADINHPDQLYLESAGGQYKEDWDPLGPFLYKEVFGDFTATVKVANYTGLYDANGTPDPNHAGIVYNNNCGIMARASDLDAGGEGEDWVSIDYYPEGSILGEIYEFGNVLKFANNDSWREWCNNGLAWDAGKYLRLSRTGNNFHAEYSFDGVEWYELECSPISRPDLEDVTVQVGLFHCTDGGPVGWAAFDDFKLVRQPWPNARGPLPTRSATDVPIYTQLSWAPGDFVQDVNGHEVHFSADFNDVNTGTTPEFIASAATVELGPLELTTEYFWRVDEVNGLEVWESEVWSFMTSDRVIVDDFDSYSGRAELRDSWKDGYASIPMFTSGSNITVSTEIDPRYPPGYHEPPGPVYEGIDTMQYSYNNTGIVTIYVPDYPEYSYAAPYFSEIEVSMDRLPMVRDWTIAGVKALALSFYGDPGNAVGATEQMYAALEDGDGTIVIAKYGDDAGEDINNLKKNEWQEWNIELKEFSDGGVDLNDVKKMYIGFGDRNSHPGPGGLGIVYFDSIALYPPRCIAGLIAGDLTNDCLVSFEDFSEIADSWHTNSPSADLDGDGEVDFKDLAIVLNKWLVSEVWP